MDEEDDAPKIFASRKKDPMQEMMDEFWAEMKSYDWRRSKEGKPPEEKESGGEEEEVESKPTDIDIDDNDADTDLEAEETTSRRTPLDVYDVACLRSCVVPSSQFRYQVSEKRVAMTHVGLKDKEVVPICIALMLNPTLASLDLTGNCLGREGIETVMQLVRNLPTLTDLNLSSNGFGSSGMKRLEHELDQVDYLRRLNIANNGFQESEADHVANIIKRCISLRSLNVSSNNLGNRGGVCIGKAIAENYTLEHLNLSWCNIRLKGVDAIAAALKDNGTLETVDLSWNGFADNGAVGIGLALKTNVSLTVLDLSANRIGPIGIGGLARGLEENTTLRELLINHNNISSLGADYLLRCIKKNDNSSITRLDLRSASLTYDTAAALLDSQQPPMVRCDSFVRSHDLIFVRDASLDKRPSPELILDLYKRVQHLDLMQYVRKFLEEKQLQDVKKEDLKRVLRRMPLPLEDEEIDMLVNPLDVDEDGIISPELLQEWCKNTNTNLNIHASKTA